MKNILWLFAMAMFCCANSVQGQSQSIALNLTDSGVTIRQILDSLSLKIDNDVDTEEGGSGVYNALMAKFWTERASRNTGGNTNMFEQYHVSLHDDIQARYSGSCSTSSYQGAWECIGPDTLNIQSIGYVECLWVNPQNSNIILAGTYGGIFKTYNQGKSWKCITDNVPMPNGVNFVMSIAANPNDTNQIIFGTGSDFATNVRIAAQGGVLYGSALYKTSNNGSSWQQELVGTSGSPGTSHDIIQKVYYTPSGNNIIAFRQNKIFIRPTSGSTWEEVTGITNPLGTSGFGAKWSDLEFIPGDANADTHFFIASSNSLWAGNIANIYEVTKISGVWSITQLTAGSSYTNLGYSTFIRMEMSIPNNGKLFAVLIDDAVSKSDYLVEYDFTTNQWTAINVIVGPSMDQFKAEFVVSRNKLPSSPFGGPLTDYNMYFGGIRMVQSWDGGQTFNQITAEKNTHDDCRHIVLANHTSTYHGTDDLLFIATDGGVTKKIPGRDPDIWKDTTCEDISGKGLTCTTLWNVATSELRGQITGGAQHQGMFSYESEQAMKWFVRKQGDGSVTVFDEQNKTQAWGTEWTSRYTQSAPGGGREIADWNRITGHINDPKMNSMAIPFWIDKANHLFSAQQNIRMNTVSGWVNISTTYSLPNISDSWIRAVAFSPYSTSDLLGYFVLERTGSTGTDRIYYINKAISNSYSDQALPANDKQVIDIAMDPNSPNRVWICMGGIETGTPTTTTKKVYYSTNSGTTWVDVSAGLPFHTPVTSIVFQEGTNNVYCSSDVGIYKCDFTNFNPGATSSGINTSVNWTCFNKAKKTSDPDFPTVWVTDLAINYCNGQLLASTYGRGIWASSLYDTASTIKPGVVFDITADATWTSSDILKGSVRVRPGKTLTISGSTTVIGMPRNSSILVDSGAYLIVDGATITNGCEGCMWEGIQVGGRLNISQLPNLQGRVWLKDATIEHARNAISNSYDGYLWNTGGIIRADRTKFLNNRKSVVLMYYSSSAKYAASFRQCTFEITEDYKDGADNKFQTHVDLNRVDGPSFYGCNFYYRLDPTGVNRSQGYGIRSTDAGFSVKPHCASTLTTPCSNYVRSNFKGFLYGVYADRSADGAHAFTVDRATFDSCSFGIRMYNLWGIPVITRDTFHVGHGVDSYIGFDCHRNVGIFSTACGGYVIQDNDFKGYTDNGWQHAQHQNWGTLIEDCGELDNQIYRCSFRELDRANVSWGKNASPYNYATSADTCTWTGLRYVCNTFVNDTTDIYVEGGNYRGGIAAWQGNFTKPAGNSFGTGSHNHIRIVNTPYPLYFYQNSGTQNPVNPSPGYSNKIAISNSNSCPVLTDDWNLPLGPDTKVNLKSTFAAGKVALRDLQTTYSGYIDGGNTSTLVSYINGSTSSDAVAVKATLLSYSPYLSTTAIKAVAEKDILSKPDLITVLEANPDLLRYPELLNYLQNEIPNPLDNGQINTLIFASQDTSARTILEANMSKQAADNQMIANFLLADMQLDSANTDIDSIPVWYNNINSLSAEYAKVGYYTGRGDYTNAASVLDGIPAKFSLTEEESTELENYIDFWTIIKDAKLDGRSIHQLNSSEIANLATLNEGSSINDRVNVGTTVVNLPPDEPIRIPCVRSVFYGWNKQGNTSKSQNSSKRAESIKIIRAYPNPADDKVVFDYTLPSSATGSMSISINNMVGQKVKELPLNNNTGRIQWDTKAVQPGVYIYKVYDRKNTLETGKLIISR